MYFTRQAKWHIETCILLWVRFVVTVLVRLIFNTLLACSQKTNISNITGRIVRWWLNSTWVGVSNLEHDYGIWEFTALGIGIGWLGGSTRLGSARAVVAPDSTDDGSENRVPGFHQIPIPYTYLISSATSWSSLSALVLRPCIWAGHLLLLFLLLLSSF